MEQFLEDGGLPWGLAETERLIPGRNQSPGTVENRLTSNSFRSSLVTESKNFVFHFVLAFLCYIFVCCFNPVQLTLSLSPSSTNNPQYLIYVSPAPRPSHRAHAPQSSQCRSIRNLRRPNRGGAEHDIMCKNELPLVITRSSSENPPAQECGMTSRFLRFQHAHLGPISSFLRCLNIK